MSGKTEQKRAETLEAKNAELEASRKEKADALDAHITQKKAEAQEKHDAKVASRKKNVDRPLTPAMKLALEAKVALDAENRVVAEACLKEIQEVAKRHGCSLHATPVIVPRGDGSFVLAANVNISVLGEQ